MGIFDIDSGADNHLLNEQFHVFSKSPASVATALGDASNRSGHTVTASDVWGQEIPAFFYAKTQAVADSYKSLAKTNDLCRIGNSVAIFENGNWVVKYNSYTDIPDGHKFKNAAGDDVIRFHKNRLAYNLNLDNNAADDGLNTTAKIQGWDEENSKVYDYVATAPKFVTQFVTSTDKIVDGIPSKGFGPFVMAGTTTGDITKVLPEGTSDANHYIANSFAGIIQFNKARTDAIYVHAFEYCGKTLKSAYSDIVELDDKLSKISVTASGGLQGVSEAATTAGLSTKWVKLVDGKEVDAQPNEEGAYPVLTISTGTIDADADDKLVTGSTVKNYVYPLEEKVNEHLLDAAGKLEITVLADKLPKKSFFEADTAYVNSYGFEWEKLSNNIYTNKFEVKVAQSLSGLTDCKASADNTVLTPASLAAQTCKLVIYSIEGTDSENKDILTEVAVSQPNTFDTSTSIYAFKFDNQISLSAGVRYRICFRTVDGTNALHCLPVIINSSNQGADVTKHETPTRYVINETRTSDDWWGCWNTPAGTVNGVQQVVYGPKVSVSGLTPTPAEDGSTLIGEKGKIYLIPNAGTENQNVYDEFVWTNNTWEKIGTTKVDLTDYAKTADLNATNVGSGAVKVSQTNGVVSSVSVETEALVDNDAIKDDTKSDTALITAKDALAAIKLAKPENYISTVSDGKTDSEGNYVNETSGETKLVIKDGREKIYDNDLWGTTVSMVGNTITVQSNPIDGTVWGLKNGYNTKGSISVDKDYPQGSKPITKVENNMVYNETTEVANIKTNELVNGSHMFSFTSLKSFSSDLNSLVNGSSMFYGSSLESFSSDLSNLVNGSQMFSDTSLASFSADLSSLVDGSQMFSHTELTSFNGDLSSLVNGNGMFSYTELTSFNGDLSSLVDGSHMFSNTELTSFNGDLSSLVIGNHMFISSHIKSFSGDLSSLVSGSYMFSNTEFTSFSGDLSSLVDGSHMFYGSRFESFNVDLSSLVDGECMFAQNRFTSFSGDLSSLVDGDRMFYYTPIESFTSDLSSLVSGSYMFYNSHLDVDSVELICDVLPNYNTENGGKKLQTVTWNEDGENKGKYTYSDWTSGNYYYPIIKIINDNTADGINRSFGTDYIIESMVKTITIMWPVIYIETLSEADKTAITKLFTDTATEKGWTFITNTELGGDISPNAVMAADGTIQYYVFAKKDEATEDSATHIDASGKLWKFDTAEAIIGPNIKYWSMFATVEDALTEWGLTPWTKPTEEETEA